MSKVQNANILNLEQRLETAKQKQAQLRAQLQQAKSRQRAADAKKRRAEDTRRKILIGAYMLQKYDKKQLAEMLNSYLTKNADRALFGLPDLRDS